MSAAHIKLIAKKNYLRGVVIIWFPKVFQLRRLFQTP